jgi:tetratricopeptide (TPR) repeat protein
MGFFERCGAQNKHEAVIETCRKGLADAPALPPLHFYANLARALVITGKTREAITEADRALRMAGAGRQFPYRLLRIEVLMMGHKYDKAESECLELLKEIKTAEEVRRVRYVLSNVYTSTKAYEKSEEQLRAILESDPSDATANNDLGYILADQNKQLDEAERLIRRALELDALERPAGESESAPNAAYIDSLGWVQYRKGQFAEARRALEQASSLPEGAADPVVWDHLGDVYLALGLPEQARGAWEKAQKLYETDKRRKLGDSYNELKRKLRQLESQARRSKHVWPFPLGHD